MATQKKIDTIANLTAKVQKATSLVFLDYRGLKHKQMEELRKNLKKHESDLTVAKNRLLLRTLADKADALREMLSDTTATVFAYADEVAPLKELLKFLKSAGVGKTKGGVLGGQVLSEAEVTRLAGLPTRDVLLGKLVGQLNAPIQGLHYALSWNINKLVWALNGVKESKTN
ncbi:50S ribosomal protein L10 [Candidatus Gottesmanbacteria bacterium]|nr:50S ribosomal protein L10 [Candidatus Gottesmanbacteria bacterium]